jgi:hypothetical protein
MPGPVRPAATISNARSRPDVGTHLDDLDRRGKNACVTESERDHGFETISGYIELRRQVDAAVFDRILVPIPVTKPHADLGFDEQWYEEPSGERRRLIERDFPFKGLFEKITD